MKLHNRVSLIIKLSKPFIFDHSAVLKGDFADVDDTWQWDPHVSPFSSFLSSLYFFSSSYLSLRAPARVRPLRPRRRAPPRYAEMAAWLAVLFYLLADTAAVYLYPSLEGLACLLGLPPAIAGATLLSLGNGAPDTLSALSSFIAGGGRGAATIRLNGNVCVRRRARRCRPPHRRPWGHRRSHQLLP